MIEKKRLTAIKSKITDIVNGKYISNQGESYVLTKKAQKIGRARILATVVDKFVSDDRKFFSITMDDGTDTIRAKSFGSFSLEKINAGDVVEIVGKIREYNDEVYINMENIWKVTDQNSEILRELEIIEQNRIMDNKKKLVLEYKKQISDFEELKQIVKEFGIEVEEVESVLESETITDPEKETEIGTDEQKEKILSSIEQLDKGDGCTYTELMEISRLPENVLDVVIEELLNEGACFEPKPGKIKKL